MRPQTFFKSKRSGALTAYPHKIFTISPPRVDKVIEKRLKFALKMSEGRIPIEAFSSVKLNVESLSLFIKALLGSLSNNPDLHEFLGNITGGNIRSVIELVTSFIGSPNVEADKIINIMKETGAYKIPLHEFTKSALLGDYAHYNPNTSLAMNVYDVSTPDSAEHFLTPILLAFLNSQGDHRDNDGFCETGRLFEELQNIGYIATQIESALRRATNKKLIETSQRVTFEEDTNGELTGAMPLSFRVTSIGAYHLHKWIATFTYFDAMIFDTPIFDVPTREDAMNGLDSFLIEKRLNRAEIFRDYLLDCWNSLVQKPLYFDFNELVSDYKYTFAPVKRFVEERSEST